VRPPADDGIEAIAASLDARPRWTPSNARAARLLVALGCSGLIGYALMHSHAARASAIIAGGLAAVALAAAVVYGRVYREGTSAVTLSAAAIMLAAVSGYGVVPGDAAAPKLLLGTAMSATVAVLAACLKSSGTTLFVAIAVAGGLLAGGAAAYLIVALPVSGAGAVLGTAAVIILASAARLAIWASPLTVPQLRVAPGDISDGEAPVDVPAAADKASSLLTAVICGSSAAAAVGATLLSLDGGLVGAMLATVIGITLVMRAANHVDFAQTAALIVSGALCFAAVLVDAVRTHPQQAHWIGLCAAGVAAVAIMPRGQPRRSSPLLRRGIELAEYCSLAVIVPLALWVCDVYSAVRGVS
jgi:type VII secretion integral membrane protein EccD